MTRHSSRAPSPTSTTSFSGKSTHYLTDSDRSISAQASTAPSSVPAIDYYPIFRTHYSELGKYLGSYLSEEFFSSPARPNLKLQTLSDHHFHELSTDVYDEITRRNFQNKVPLLPAKEESQSERKHNARQKLATFSTERLKGLSSEVYFEVERRYPELKENEVMNIMPLEDSEAVGHANIVYTDDKRLQQLNEELTAANMRIEEQALAVQSLQERLDILQKVYDCLVSRAEEDQKEVVILRDQCRRLEAEKEITSTEIESEKVQRKSDVNKLEAQIMDLSSKNSVLTMVKESDNAIIRRLENEVHEYRRKHEQIQAELEHHKAPSNSAPALVTIDEEDDQVLIMASECDVPDVHVRAFVSATNKLLVAGRSYQSRRVLKLASEVADAIGNIVQDINAFEQRRWKHRSDINLPALRMLRDRAREENADLLKAAKVHASSSGMSPFALLETPAKQLSATITEIGRTLYIPQAQAEDPPYVGAVNAGQPLSRAPWTPAILRSMSASQTASTASSRNASQFSTSNGVPRTFGSKSSFLSLDLGLPSVPGMQRSLSGTGSSEQTGSPVRISMAAFSDDSEPTEKSEETAGMFHPYLETQMESFATAVQSLLAGMTNPMSWPAQTENLAEMIKIASNVIETYDANLPVSVIRRVDAIRGLRDHTTKLKRLQALQEVTKDSWHTTNMAKSSFAILNEMEELLKP